MKRIFRYWNHKGESTDIQGDGIEIIPQPNTKPAKFTAKIRQGKKIVTLTPKDFSSLIEKLPGVELQKDSDN